MSNKVSPRRLRILEELAVLSKKHLEALAIYEERHQRNAYVGNELATCRKLRAQILTLMAELEAPEGPQQTLFLQGWRPPWKTVFTPITSSRTWRRPLSKALRIAVE